MPLFYLVAAVPLFALIVWTGITVVRIMRPELLENDISRDGALLPASDIRHRMNRENADSRPAVDYVRGDTPGLINTWQRDIHERRN